MLKNLEKRYIKAKHYYYYYYIILLNLIKIGEELCKIW